MIYIKKILIKNAKNLNILSTEIKKVGFSSSSFKQDMIPENHDTGSVSF